MPDTIEPNTPDVELIELQLFPSEPPAASDRLVAEDELPYDLVGAEPEPIMVRVAERFGLPQRVLVAPAAEEGDGEYRPLEDARWIRAAREAGVDRIPVRVLGVRGLAAELLVLILNQQRPANVAAQVDALERLLEAGIPEGELARASGMTRGRVRRLAGLMELDPVLRQALREDRIKPQVAFTAAEQPGDVQAALVASFEREGQLTSAQVRQLRENMGAEEARERAEAETATEAGDNPEVALQHLLSELGSGEEDPTQQVRRQAKELLQALPATDLPTELRARLAQVLEEIEHVPA
jgi:hypothetical protein